MDIATFEKVAKALPANISIMVRGKHGIGKSEVVKQIALALGFTPDNIFDRRMSQMTEGDVIGLPKIGPILGSKNNDEEVTRFLPPDWIKRACTEACFLFLDEVNRATQEVMQACFQLCLDRELNGNKLHPGSRIFTAVNASADYQVNEMDPAFLDRFFVVDLTPSAEDFFAHADGKIDPDLLRFLKERDTRLDPSPNGNPGKVEPSRRSWFRLDTSYKSNKVYEMELATGVGDSNKGFAHALAVGFVGIEEAGQLVDFLSKRESRFTAVNVYREYPQHQAKIRKLGQDKLNTLIDMLVDYAKTETITPEEAKNLAAFVLDLPGELRVSFITNYTKGTRPTALFGTNFKTINAAVMPLIVNVFNDKKQAEELTGKDSTAGDLKAKKK